MGRKIILALSLILFSVGLSSAQQRSEVQLQAGERWWGVATSMGSMMPIEAGSKIEKRSIITSNYGNQVAPVLISNQGRYIYSEKPFAFEFDGAKFTFESSEKIEAVREPKSKTLREAYVTVKDKFFKTNGQLPPELFFSMPQYNTWIELQYNQNQDDIEKYADAVVGNGFPVGILMVDDNWQRYYGNFEFKAERFSDPKGMIERLHRKGFKVMLWVCPFVSPDSPEFRELERKGYLIKEKGTDRAAMIRWWNGVSACYDLTHPEAMRYVLAQLNRVQEVYGVDGYKLDAGDTYFYNPKTQDYYDPNATAVDHVMKWAEVGLHFPYNEYRAAYGMQGYPLVQRLNDKNNSWGALANLIPEMLNAGLMGYPYTCADLIGGGQVADFLSHVDQTKLDQDLIVRSAQVHALMPMMQFSVAPWRVLDDEHLGYCRDAAKLHEKMAPYILELAKQAAKTGEPIVRHMEYMYPNKGFSDCNDQFMLGHRILVAPILSSDNKRTVRLPKGTWTDDQGRRFKGPLVMEVTAPVGRLPYYELNKK